MKILDIKPINKNNQEWIVDLLTNHWASPKIVSRGKIYDASKLPGFIAWQENKPIGLLTYCFENNECEIITLDSLKENIGIGSSLIDAVKKITSDNKCKRIWCITTNNNQKAIRYYQNRGFKIKKVHKNAMETSRKLKPEIPLVDDHGIPIKDEVELEIILETN